MLELIGLGLAAGVIPVYLGIGAAMVIRRTISRSWESALIGIATGVLVFLFFDLMHESEELTGARDPLSWVVFLGSLFLGFVVPALLEERQLGKGRRADRLLSLPYVIAAGIGLHNFGEGLAIGASYANGEWALSWLLVAGFALHNGTEGFGIVGAAGQASISTKDALGLGAIAALPTCLGTLLSGFALSPYFTILWFALAAGSLLYVVCALVATTYTATRKVSMVYGMWGGIALMFLTAKFLLLVGGVKS